MIYTFIASFLLGVSTIIYGRYAVVHMLIAKVANRIPISHYAFLQTHNIMLLFYIDDYPITADELNDNFDPIYSKFNKLLYLSDSVTDRLLEFNFKNNASQFIERLEELDFIIFSNKTMKKNSKLLSELAKGNYKYTFMFDDELKELFKFYSI